MLTLERLLHLSKVKLPIELMLVGMLMLDSLAQALKVQSPSDVSELGNDTFVRPVQLANAPLQ